MTSLTTQYDLRSHPLGTQMDYRFSSAPFLPVSHQPRETDSLTFIHVCVVLSHKAALDLEGPDHCSALERLGHMGTHG